MSRLQLLVPIHTYQEGHDERFAGQAASIAKHLGADIQALIHEVTFPDVSNPFGKMLVDVPAIAEEVRAAGRARGGAIVDALMTAIGSDSVKVAHETVECFAADFGAVAARRARYSDFVILGMIRNSKAVQVAAETAVFSSGRPVVLFPELYDPATLDQIAIAWDDSRSAARAVADALPMLHHARATTVLTVTDEKPLPGGSIGERLLDYLARHEVAATCHYIERSGQPVGDSLQEAAQQIGATLLVMGGFGHSRIRDFVLGGATRSVLGNPRMPVLLSH